MLSHYVPDAAGAAVAAVAAALELDERMLAATVALNSPRFIRVVPNGVEISVSSVALAAQLGCDVADCAWLPGVLVAEGAAKLHDCAAYASGRVAGIDAGSAAAAFSLNPLPGHAVLDLCCAPGSKLLLLSQLMNCSGWLCGVDISHDRLAAAATVLRKYRAVHPGVVQTGWRVQLFCTDGTRFLSRVDSTENEHACPTCPIRVPATETAKVGGSEPVCRLVLDSWAENVIRKTGGLFRGLPPALRSQQLENIRQQRCRRFGVSRCDCIAPDPAQHWCSCALHRESAGVSDASAATGERLVAAICGTTDAASGSALCTSSSSAGIFDRVLVDAECTHDGSVKHLAKFATQWGWDSFERRVLDPCRLSGLQALQRGLLSRGFRLLKAGGVLVYSTCSLTTAQNEDVVRWLLETHPDARLIPIDPSEITRNAARAAMAQAQAPREGTHAGTAGPQPCSTIPASDISAVCPAVCAADEGHSEVPCEAESSPPSVASDPLHLSVHSLPIVPCCPGLIPGTIRFAPLQSGGVGGLFISRITKLGDVPVLPCLESLGVE